MPQEIDGRTRERMARRANGYREEGLEAELDRREREQRERDLKVIASTMEGQRILTWLVTKNRRTPFTNSGVEGYNAGLRHAGEAIEDALENALPWELFAKIVLPQKNKEEL